MKALLVKLQKQRLSGKNRTQFQKLRQLIQRNKKKQLQGLCVFTSYFRLTEEGASQHTLFGI